jgi:type VI secretion system protein ImpK
MSNGKPPSDPFSSERTVIRPNPGGRREAMPAQSRTQPPAQEDIWGGVRKPPQDQPFGQTPAAFRPEPPRPITSEWPKGAQPLPLAFANDLQVPDKNPIMEAAKPLLLLLSNLRVARQLPRIAPLMDSVAQAIETFERQLRSASVAEQQVTTAKYAICATADDIVQNLPGSDRHLWTQYSMLSRFFQARTSGVGFFDELARIRSNPALNYDLLELMHACMSLGFEGQYRATGGDVTLQQIRRDVYQTLRHLKARATDEISPHWKGLNIAPQYVRNPLPAWAVASLTAGLLLATFIALRWLLGGSSDAIADKLATLHPDTEVLLARSQFTPMEEVSVPETTQLQRIRTALAEDISAKRLSADYAGKDIVVRLLNDVVFDKGSASVRDSFLDALVRIAQTLDKEPGRIHIVGHTDDTPLKSAVKFKDNQDLSEKRADAVANLMRPYLSDKDRIDISGLADTAPLDRAKTAEARARNRRVEVFIPREDL